MSTQKKDVKIVSEFTKESFDQQVANLEAIGYAPQGTPSNNTSLHVVVMVREINNSN